MRAHQPASMLAAATASHRSARAAVMELIPVVVAVVVVADEALRRHGRR